VGDIVAWDCSLSKADVAESQCVLATQEEGPCLGG
jgi:hypothetical protein